VFEIKHFSHLQSVSLLLQCFLFAVSVIFPENGGPNLRQALCTETLCQCDV